eukprot:INCI1789.1.p1 GENE.INCI1789.1~~INCI1789.1.p1  ORF type:complete len:612 (-),score=87.92 INCI1789.1:260-1996(-)
MWAFLVKALGFYGASVLVVRLLRFVHKLANLNRTYQTKQRHGAAGKIAVQRMPQPRARDLVAELSAPNGTSSVHEVVDNFINRADEVSKASGSNCVVSCDALRAQAREHAKVLDTALSRKAVRAEDAPLFGLPISVKECFQVKDTVSTHGLKRYEGDAAADADESVLVKMLRNLGAVPFCKTNVPQIMYSWECSNPVYGTTSNPLHLDYVPGGSSGGEGCLIAQGGSIIGLGTDIGGSCRIPAHMSGCVGLKASKHRLASRGKGRSVTYGAQAVVASCAGLLSRTVDDMAFVLEHLCSPRSIEHGRTLDTTLLPIPWRADVYADTRPLRIAYYDFDGYIEASPACRRAVHEAADALKAAGHKLVRFNPPDISEAMEIFFALLSCGADHIADELQGETVADALTKLMLQTIIPYPISQLAAKLKQAQAPIWAGMVKNLYIKDSTEYYTWVQRKMEWVNKYNDALDALNRDGDGAIDVILSPVHVLPTHKHGEAAGTHSLVALNLNLCWFLPRRAGCESIFALLQSKCWFSYWQQRHHTLVRVRGDIQPAGLLCWRRTHYRCEARGRLLGTKTWRTRQEA